MGLIIGTPYTRGAGYSVNDKDLPTRQEADVQTCSHCQAVIRMQQWRDNGAWCGKCMHPLCAACGERAATFGCEPFMKKLEQYAEQQMRFTKFRKDAGLDEPATPQTTLAGSR